jgi:hypothetical protein
MVDKLRGEVCAGYSGAEDNMLQNATKWFNRTGNSEKTFLQSEFRLNLGRTKMKIVSVVSRGGLHGSPNGKSRVNERERKP